MKKKISILLASAMFISVLLTGSYEDAQAATCWFDMEGGCDASGYVQCGACNTEFENMY